MLRFTPFFLLLLCAALPGQQPEDATLVIKARTVWLAPGEVREKVAIVVEHGIVTAIVPQSSVVIPAGAEVIDVPGGTVTAGLVHAYLRPSGVVADGPEAITPAVIAADAFDPFQPQSRLLRGGIIAAYLTPGFERLVSGQGSVVRVGAADPLTSVMKRSASLRINLGEGPRATPDIFKPPVLPGPDNPLPPATPQGPKNRAGAMAELRSLFGKAAARQDRDAAPAEGEIDLRPLAAALDGKLPVRIAADREADILRAIDLAREFHLKLVIEGGNEAGALAAQLKAVGAAVVVRASLLPPIGSSELAPVFRPAGQPDPSTPRRLAEAGVPFAIIPPTEAEAGNLFYWAARATAHGLSLRDALASVTTRAAEIVGLESAVARIIESKPATLLVWNGDPVEVTARPALVIVDGRVVQRTKVRDDLVAITAKRIHTCNGDPIEQGTILVDHGKIRSIGRDLAIPPDARRVVHQGVIVPGFIDGGTQVGIRGYQLTSEEGVELAGPLGALGMEQRLSKYFDADLPAVRAAALAGVTTAALMPGPGRPLSGAISVVKMTGPRSQTMKKIGGILFDLSTANPGEGARKQLDGMLEAGKKYHDSWAQYDKALDEWKRGKKPVEEKPERVVGAVKSPKPLDPVSGTWEGSAHIGAIPRPINFTLKLKLDGQKVTGSLTMQGGRRGGGGRDLQFEGRFEDGKIHVVVEEGQTRIEIDGTVGRDVMNGSLRIGPLGDATFEATRTDKAGEAGSEKPAEDKAKDDKKTAVDDGRPKPPTREEAQEPFRELFSDAASAYVIVSGEELVDIVLDVLRTKYDVRTVIVTTQDIRYYADRYAAAGVALVPTAASIREEEGVLVNPALIAVQKKIPVLFRTGHDGDPRQLYGIAEMAVRDGVDPEDALRMITRQPARFLGLLDRVGSLERGKDADLVLLSGEPFMAGTAVNRVMIDGRFVDEETSQ